jgi:hypothetical protein
VFYTKRKKKGSNLLNQIEMNQSLLDETHILICFVVLFVTWTFFYFGDRKEDNCTPVSQPQSHHRTKKTYLSLNHKHDCIIIEQLFFYLFIYLFI